MREIQRGDGLPNADSGWDLRVNKSGRKKMGDNADQSLAESKAVAGLESLAKHAVIAERHTDIEHNNEFVQAVYRLYAPLVIDGVAYRIKLTVKDYVGVNAKKELHALAAVEIESALPGISPSYSNPEGFQTGQPTTERIVSIADLLNGASMSDGKLFGR